MGNKKRFIFFDADDTLWENERYFREAEKKFVDLLSGFSDRETVRRILAEKQEENIPVFGYGSKTYLIGMADAAAAICEKDFSDTIYRSINTIIRNLVSHELHLIDGVRETLESLQKDFKPAVATKGDLMEQMGKFRQSGLAGLFHHMEVMENKDEENYSRMAAKLDIRPDEIIMVGNSVKSDIAPVLNIGGHAVHIPHEIEWEHEKMELPSSDRVFIAKNFKEVPVFLYRICGLAQ